MGNCLNGFAAISDSNRWILTNFIGFHVMTAFARIHTDFIIFICILQWRQTNSTGKCDSAFFTNYCMNGNGKLYILLLFLNYHPKFWRMKGVITGLPVVSPLIKWICFSSVVVVVVVDQRKCVLPQFLAVPAQSTGSEAPKFLLGHCEWKPKKFLKMLKQFIRWKHT